MSSSFRRKEKLNAHTLKYNYTFELYYNQKTKYLSCNMKNFKNNAFKNCKYRAFDNELVWSCASF